MSIDPLTKKSRRFSPYIYALNNPVYFIDPNGMEATAALDDAEANIGGGGDITDGGSIKDEGVDAGYGRKITANNSTMAVNGDGTLSERKSSNISDNKNSKNESDDNGYKKDGKGGYTQVSNEGGNSKDYLYGEDGNLISSTDVTYRGVSSRELYSNGGELNGYGYRGWKLATGAIEQDNTLFEIYAGGKIFSAGMSYLSKSLTAATGGLKQWFRYGSSYSIKGDFATKSIQWGAGGRHWQKIGNTTLQNANKSFRQTKLPGNNWRVQDPGHFHIKKN